MNHTICIGQASRCGCQQQADQQPKTIATFQGETTTMYGARVVLYRRYHVVARTDVKRRVASATACLKEIKARQHFTKRYYGGRYDRRHRHWMRELACNIPTHARLAMSLDDVVAVMKAEA